MNVEGAELRGEETANQSPPEWDSWVAGDDVKGGPLPAHLVYAARVRELECLRHRKVYDYSTTREALRLTGKQPLGLTWIDTNKGGRGYMNIRARLVATEVRRFHFLRHSPFGVLAGPAGHAHQRIPDWSG